MEDEELSAGVPRQLEISYDKAVKLDSVDKQILTLLSKFGRMSYVDIAKKVGLSSDGVKYRIERMLKEHVIQGFVAVVNPPNIGLPMYTYIFLSLWNVSIQREKELIDYVRSAPYLVYAAKTMGRWDVYLEYYARDANHLDQLIADLREKFSDIIREIEMIPIIKEYKWAEFPGVLD